MTMMKACVAITTILGTLAGCGTDAQDPAHLRLRGLPNVAVTVIVLPSRTYVIFVS